MAVAACGWSAGHGAGYRLVLVGVGLAAALQSVIQYLFTRADVYDAQLALRWLTGSVSAADWPTIRLLALLLLGAAAAAWSGCARSLRVDRARRGRRRGPRGAAPPHRPAARCSPSC